MQPVHTHLIGERALADVSFRILWPRRPGKRPRRCNEPHRFREKLLKWHLLWLHWISRKAALVAYWGRGVDLVLFPGESAKTKLILKRYVRGIIYNLYKATNGSFSWIAFNSVASLSLTVCADRNVFRETFRFEWRFLSSQLLYCGEGSQITLHWIKERETWAKYWKVDKLKF